MQSVCIFVHMPKAGGSTLQEVIQRQYPPAATLDIHGESVETVQVSVDRLRRMPEQERAAIACVKGHVPFGVHRWLPGNARYVTMLRDPVERTVSAYFFAMNTPGHRLFEQMRRDRPSLKDFVVMRGEQGLGDMYCRLLGGVANWDRLAESPRELPEDALDIARENLERNFAVAGITERFDESLLLMQRAFGWRDIRYERANVTRDKPVRVALSDEEMAAVRRYNGRDIALYEFARQRMDARIAEEGAGFEVRVRRFRRENARYRRWCRFKRAVASRLPAPIAQAIRTLRHGSPS